jgi:hypothetical protein
MPTNYGNTGSGYRHGTTGRRNSPNTKNCAPGYKNICDNFNRKIASYKTLCGQGTGPAKRGRPTPATLNNFSKWIEKGAYVCKVSPAQVKRWAKTTQQIKSPTTAKNMLAKCFGRNVIKAVTTDKQGGFLVACSGTVNGRPFNFPR